MAPPSTPRSRLPSLVAVAALAAIGVASAPSPPTVLRVVLDPGHGGSDPGAIGNGLQEKDLNLEVALRLRDLLDADTADAAGGAAWEVLLTRDGDQSVSLASRVALANAWPADRFLSIHHNGFSSSSANGTETFSFANGTVGADLRDLAQEELLLALGLTDRGTKTANFFVLSQTAMPAALTEAGFMTNPGDMAVIGNDAGLQAEAEALLFALQRHVGASPYLPGPSSGTYCEAKLNSAGCLPAIGSSALPSLTSPPVTITCEGVPPSTFGLLLWSAQPDALPFFGGTLCIASPLGRFSPVLSTPYAGPCGGLLQTELDPVWLLTQGFSAGSSIYLQWWHRDPALGINPVALSDGLQLVIQP